MDETTESREDRLVREIRQSRGWILPEQEYLARNDYEFYVRHGGQKPPTSPSQGRRFLLSAAVALSLYKRVATTPR